MIGEVRGKKDGENDERKGGGLRREEKRSSDHRELPASEDVEATALNQSFLCIRPLISFDIYSDCFFFNTFPIFTLKNCTLGITELGISAYANIPLEKDSEVEHSDYLNSKSQKSLKYRKKSQTAIFYKLHTTKPSFLNTLKWLQFLLEIYTKMRQLDYNQLL